MPEVDVAGLRAQVVEGRHAEVDTHGVALDDGGQQRLAARAHQRSDIHVALGDVARDGRLHGRIAQDHFGLREIGFADHDIRSGTLVRGDGVVEVELARGALLVERADALQVALRLEGLRLGLVQLCPGLVGPGPVEARVNDEKGLAPLDIGSFGEEHLLEISLYPGADLDELLGADASHVLAVNAHVLGLDGLRRHNGQHDRHGTRPQPPPQSAGKNDKRADQHDPTLAVHRYRHARHPLRHLVFPLSQI